MARDIEWPADGERICVTGQGMANMLHYHPTIVRRTRTMLITSGPSKFGVQNRRFYIETGREVGAHQYGGTTARTSCRLSRKGS